MRLKLLVVLGVLAAAGCGGGNKNVECKIHADCNLSPGGSCDIYAMTGNRWCSYPDAECPSDRRWSDFEVGDGLSGACQDEEIADVDAGSPDAATPDGMMAADAGVTDAAAIDAAVNDAAVNDAPPAVDGGISCDEKILFARDDGTKTVRTINPNGTSDVAVFTGAAAAFDWSHDGASILVVDDDTLRILDTAGTQTGSIVVGSAISAAVWSPVAPRIAYVTRVSDVSELHVINADGSGDVQIYFTSKRIENPKWLHSGDKIAVHIYVPVVPGPGESDLYVMNDDGTGLLNLTMSAGTEYFGRFDWTPNDTKVVFGFGNLVIADIGSILVNGTMRVDLTNDAGAFIEEDPVVSPDGSLVLYSAVNSVPDTSDGVYRRAFDGSGVVKLAGGDNGLSRSFEPQWSPDGMKIAYSSSLLSTDLDIWVMQADGSAQVRLTTTGDNTSPIWRRCP